MRVMFYLPVVTPWWFENIVVHLIRRLAQAHEVHVLIAPMWSGTGIGPRHFHLLEGLAYVHWHVLDGADHALLRTDASDVDELAEFAAFINPDLTLCRSADIKTPRRFPGEVRYIMEAGAPPFETGANRVILTHTLFDYGELPAFPDEQEQWLDALADQLFAAKLPRWECAGRDELMQAAGLEEGRALVGLPLEYEHEENFFWQHLPYPDNATLIREVAAQLDDDTRLLVTNHPLNDLYGDNSAIEETIAALEGKAALVPHEAVTGSATHAIARHADAVVIGNSKSWCLCAVAGTTVIRLSDFATGDWLNAYASIPDWLADLEVGRPRQPDAIKARRWFAFHMVNRVFDPADSDLLPDDIIERALNPVSPARWEAALSRMIAPLGEAA